MHFQTVDLTRQRLKLSERLFGGADEIHVDDATVDALARQGLIDVSWEATAPSNERKLWFHRVVPTGSHGILKCYDADLDQWVKLTPERFRIYQSVTARPRWWATSKLGTAARPPDDEVLVGDWWEHDTGSDNEISIYRQLGPNNKAWVDITGGELDIGVITRHITTYRSGPGMPPGEYTAIAKDGDRWRNTTTQRRYEFWSGEGWRDYIA